MTLDELFRKHGADKHNGAHGYATAYERHLRGAGPGFRLLEIGVSGGSSIRSWLEYLPQAEITGVDTCPYAEQFARFMFYLGDQTDEQFMRQVGRERGPFDMIVDDAGHQTISQQACFRHLWTDYVKPGGVYVIEDIQCWFDPKQSPIYNTDWQPFLHELLSSVNHGGRDYLGRFAGAEVVGNPPYDMASVSLNRGQIWIYKK